MAASVTAQMRKAWRDFECKEDDMVVVSFGPDRILVAPPTTAAWEALAEVFARHGYVIRTADTDSYNCRNIKGTSKKSLHSYGIALDVNWNTNPFITHQGKRSVRFSDTPDQQGRAEDARLGKADTDMTPAMIEDVMAIHTSDGDPVFRWGGHYRSSKDAMHFEIVLPPAVLNQHFTAQGGSIPQEDVASDRPDPVITPGGAGPHIIRDEAADTHVVIAREGANLKLRPADDAPTKRVLAAGTTLEAMNRLPSGYAMVDLERDGLADGFVLGPSSLPAVARRRPESRDQGHRPAALRPRGRAGSSSSRSHRPRWPRCSLPQPHTRTFSAICPMCWPDCASTASPVAAWC